MASIASKYVLAGSALIAFLWGEAGAQTVEDVLIEDDAEVFMSAVNLGEVMHIVHRLAGEQAARKHPSDSGYLRHHRLGRPLV